jgi:predicted MFS family arabinose efflux permease
MPPAGAPPSQTRFITHLSLIGFASALSTRAVDPIVPPVAQGLAVDPGMVALLSTAFALPFAFMQPILGPVSDMIGKVRLMMICLVVIILASVVCAFATSFSTLLAARIVCGMAAGGIFPVGMALIGDMVAVEGRQVAIARWLAIVIGGNVIGGAFAGVIADLFGWRAVFLGGAAVGLATFVNAMINLRQAVSAKPGPINLRSIPSSFGAILANPKAKFCFLAVYLEGIAVFGLFPFVALLLLMATGETRSSIAGAVLAAFSLGGIAYSLTARQMTRRWRPSQMMIGGGALCTLTMAIIALDMAWPVQFALFALLGVGFYTLHSCIQVEASELSTTSRGAAMSLHSLFFFLGHASGPVLYGMGFRTIGAASTVLLGGALMLFTGLMCARYLRRA